MALWMETGYCVETGRSLLSQASTLDDFSRRYCSSVFFIFKHIQGLSLVFVRGMRSLFFDQFLYFFLRFFKFLVASPHEGDAFFVIFESVVEAQAPGLHLIDDFFETLDHVFKFFLRHMVSK